ncbi:hypothetical protein GOC91_01490 [Sinorhizobium medicae]|uniref:Uncharacterized protein n=2 Tax=Sinorhizobium medicae TaxID=110321 RepID=A0A6G1WWG5_9HYPH|nr:hypothetical protein Smed_4265 [Sinorhizobium medicae WSM419]MDX0403566.1 hypothetical protein [Sinorhizobium medicae]MDX0409430.1 hypothetical protein [Sinorhizobium medicae]MDX0415545.1 hypothetical protein [Sinorhizobium medicae]MDX0421527.1 hypothetical protein [Sinorhizobium medicae]
MLVLQCSPYDYGLALASQIDYVTDMQNHRRIIMPSQRQLAKRAEPGFMLQLWNAMLGVQTRGAASLFSSRTRSF